MARRMEELGFEDEGADSGAGGKLVREVGVYSGDGMDFGEWFGEGVCSVMKFGDELKGDFCLWGVRLS
ncbi:hypothetical protein V6N12_038655 [Hibiscus sabdariffa]|uniref:Uncharacterized protein n=1 Tax=Hibiscus sabdariffa TaxID=183260 RepID=A0ABR2CAG6_9ROSI